MFAGVRTINTNVHARSNSVGAYVIDTAKIGSHWELNGSFRYDRFNSHYTQAVPPVAAFNRLDHLPSWRGAVVYKPVQPLSIYVSAGNSFNPSAESLSLSANTTSLPPQSLFRRPFFFACNLITSLSLCAALGFAGP